VKLVNYYDEMLKLALLKEEVSIVVQVIEHLLSQIHPLVTTQEKQLYQCDAQYLDRNSSFILFGTSSIELVHREREREPLF
jgi:hypothetical protein